MKFMRMGLLWASVMVLSSSTAWASIYYVSPGGSDADPGTEALPWRTIGHAAATLTEGNTVYIRAGIYHERVAPRRSGADGAWITYAAYPGEAPVIDGAGVEVPEWAGLFDITQRAYIRMSGLRVINSVSNPHNPGILVESSQHIVIEDNSIASTNDSGIGVWSSQEVMVDGNTVEKICQAGWNECISVGGSDTVVVRDNIVHDSDKEGICVKDGSSNVRVFGNEVYQTTAVGFYVDAQDQYTHAIEVFGNLAHDIAENGFALASEAGGRLENISVHDNIAYANGWTGIQITACCIQSHPMWDLRIVNNTFYDNGRGGWGGGVYLENPQARGAVIRNNLVSQNLSFQIVVDPGVPLTEIAADHNLIDGFRGDPAEITGEAHVEGNPQFIDAAGADFHIAATSPAVDAGSAEDSPASDFEGTPRPQGAGFDIGAFEYRVHRHARPLAQP